MKHIYLICLIILTSACSTQTIRVVDSQGNAVKGALVVSEQSPYIFQFWNLGAYITNDEGEAKVVTSRGHIFKSGYYPVINASELDDTYLWDAPSYFSSATTIYTVQKENIIPVNISTHVINKPNKDGSFDIPLEVCRKKHVTYNIQNSKLKVKSNVVDLLGSERFYFVGPSDVEKKSVVENENNLAFYCNDNGRMYKVGISVSVKLWRIGAPSHKLTIFSANVSSLSDYIQPDIKCLTDENMRVSVEYRTDKPDMYTSDNLKEEILEYGETIPCANENTTRLIKYIEGYL